MECVGIDFPFYCLINFSAVYSVRVWAYFSFEHLVFCKFLLFLTSFCRVNYLFTIVLQCRR